MNIYLLRHAEPDYANDCPFPGPPLTAKGEKQARTAQAELSQIPFDKVFCSDYLRTKQTAKPFENKYMIIYDSRLREGSDYLNGYSETNELDEHIPSQTERLDQFLEEIKTLKATNVLIITHFNVIEYLSRKLGKHISAPQMASIHVLEI